MSGTDPVADEQHEDDSEDDTPASEGGSEVDEAWKIVAMDIEVLDDLDVLGGA